MMRYVNLLRHRYYAILHYLGIIIIGLGLFALVPLLLLIFGRAEFSYAVSFLLTALIGLGIGGALVLKFRGMVDLTPSIEESGVLVLLAWLSAILLSALPFIFSGQLSVFHAIYESTSGWTTTGLSVIDVTQAPDVILLWRSLMQFAGGAGIAVIMLAAIIGPYGMGLYQAEARTDQLLPHVRRSAALIMYIYIGYTLVGVLALVMAGMPLFDAINHAIAALSTGGFSTRVDSIGEYASLPVELITIILMLAGTTNFAIHYLLLQGKLRKVARYGEVRLLFLLILVSVPFIIYTATLSLYGSLSEAARITIFNTVSAISTTGFSTVDLSVWGESGILAMVILMLIGGGAGSTAGGIKLIRIYLAAKAFWWELQAHFLPQNTIRRPYIWRAEERFYVTEKHVNQVTSYIILYFVTFMLGVLALVAQGFPLRESMFEFASSLSTVGLSVGLTGPHSPPGLLGVQMIGMVLGRLEFLVIFFASVKLFRDFRYLSMGTQKQRKAASLD